VTAIPELNVASSSADIAYDAVASAYARHRGGHGFIVEILQRLHRESPGDAMLEIGCGTGAYASALAQMNAPTVYAMDLSLQMLRRAPAGDTVAYLQGRAARLPFADGTLDMVFSVNVIHHLRNVAPYFRESLRILRPGGIFCTATDSRAIIERRKPLSHYWPETVPVELERYHALETLRAEMAAAGFCPMGECEGRSEFSVSDIGAYQDKAYSCLQLIEEEAFLRGLRAMESDLRLGPIHGASELVFLWAKRP
jgi:ubiquinone/menaquinone biosynthesis C-methylase UbiE